MSIRQQLKWISSLAFWTSLDRAAQTSLWESIDQSILGPQIPYLINLMTQLISAAQRRQLPTISTTSTSPYARAERGSHYVHRRVVILKTKPNWTLSRPLGWDPNLLSRSLYLYLYDLLPQVPALSSLVCWSTYGRTGPRSSPSALAISRVRGTRSWCDLCIHAVNWGWSCGFREASRVRPDLRYTGIGHAATGSTDVLLP